MKIRLMSVVTLVILLVTSCETDHIKPSEDKEWIKKVQIEEEPELMDALADIGIKSNSGGRTATTSFGELNLAEAIKVVDTENEAIRYSLKLESGKNNRVFENLVVAKKKNKTMVYLIQMEADVEWLWEHRGERSLESFTGVARQLDLERTVLAEENITGGSSGSKGGRTQTCCTWSVGTSTATGLPLYFLKIDCAGEVYMTYRTQDCSSYDGGVPTGGYTTGGDTSGGTTSGGGTSTGSTSTTTSTGDKIGFYMTDEDWERIEEECIYNQLTTPCLKNTADKVLNPGVASTFNKLMQDVFNRNETTNVFLQEGVILGPDGKPNNALGATGQAISTGGMMNVTITLDPTKFNGASQEFTAAAMYHECFHAIVNTLCNNSVPSDAQHIAAFTNYLNLLANGLQAMYPNLAPGEAQSLILYGLIALDGGTTPKPGKWTTEFVDKILLESKFSRAQISTAISKYQVYTYFGTRCN